MQSHTTDASSLELGARPLAPTHACAVGHGLNPIFLPPRFLGQPCDSCLFDVILSTTSRQRRTSRDARSKLPRCWGEAAALAIGGSRDSQLGISLRSVVGLALAPRCRFRCPAACHGGRLGIGRIRGSGPSALAGGLRFRGARSLTPSAKGRRMEGKGSCPRAVGTFQTNTSVGSWGGGRSCTGGRDKPRRSWIRGEEGRVQRYSHPVAASAHPPNKNVAHIRRATSDLGDVRAHRENIPTGCRQV